MIAKHKKYFLKFYFYIKKAYRCNFFLNRRDLPPKKKPTKTSKPQHTKKPIPNPYVSDLESIWEMGNV